MRLLRDAAPELADRIDTLVRDRGETVDRVMGRVTPRVRELLSTKRDSKMFKLRVEEISQSLNVFDEAKKLWRMTLAGGDAAAITAQRGALREAVSHGFDARAKVLDEEISLLSERVESLRKEHVRRLETREASIDRFVEELAELGQPPKGDRPPRDGKPPRDGGNRPPR